MSKSAGQALAIEWSPEAVRVWNPVSGRIATGATLADVSDVFGGLRHAVVGLARTHAFTKRIALPKASPDDMRQMLQFQIGQHVPLPPDQVSFDFSTTDVRMDDGFLTLLAVARTEDIRQLRSAMAQAGIAIDRILPICLAAPIAIRSAGRSSGLVIDHWLGQPTHDGVFDGHWVYGRTADQGEDEEREIARTLAAAGMGPLESVLGPQPGDGGFLLRHLPDVTGIALEPAEDRLQRERRKRVARTRFGILMLLAALLLVAWVWDERDRNAAVLRRGEGTWARQLSQLRSIRKTEQAKAAEATKVRSALDRSFVTAQSPNDIVHLVSGLLPTDIWLTGVSAERGKPVQIRGTAVSAEAVARLVATLSGSPRFREVRLLFANASKIDETPVVQFSITAVAVGNLPMPEPDKAARKSRTAAKDTK